MIHPLIVTTADRSGLCRANLPLARIIFSCVESVAYWQGFMFSRKKQNKNRPRTRAATRDREFKIKRKSVPASEVVAILSVDYFISDNKMHTIAARKKSVVYVIHSNRLCFVS